MNRPYIEYCLKSTIALFFLKKINIIPFSRTQIPEVKNIAFSGRIANIRFVSMAKPPSPLAHTNKLRYLWHTYLRHQKRLLVPAIILGGISALCAGIGLPTIVQKVFPIVFGEAPLPDFLLDRLKVNHTPEQIASITLWSAAALLPLLMLVKGIAQYLNTYILSKAGLRILEQMRMRVFQKLQELPLSFHEKFKRGDLLNRLLTETQQTQELLLNILNDLVIQPMILLGAFAYLLFASWGSSHVPTLLVNMLLVAACVPIIKKIGTFILKRTSRMFAGLANITVVIEESLAAQRDIRAFCLEERQNDTLKAETKEFYSASMRMVVCRQAITPAVEIASAFALAYALYVGSSHGITTLQFAAIGTALYYIYDALKRLGTVHNLYTMMSGLMNRLNEIIYAEDKMPEPVHPIPLGRARGQVTFDHVTFSYDEVNPVLHDICIDVSPGEVVALVGHSGSGKTTFINLLSRFYDVQQGAVKIDCIDVRDISNDELRDAVGLVSQHPVLFRGTIMDNIRLGRRTAEDEEVMRAGKLAYLDDFVTQDPAGYDRMIGEGGEGLSGGQRQRVSIARAFLKNPPILILDEATASLDMSSEEKIQASLSTLTSDRTTFIIAHRFSTIRLASRILVFDQGRIIGDGTHEELYANSLVYRDLYNKQITNRVIEEVSHA